MDVDTFMNQNNRRAFSMARRQEETPSAHYRGSVATMDIDEAAALYGDPTDDKETEIGGASKWR